MERKVEKIQITNKMNMEHFLDQNNMLNSSNNKKQPPKYDKKLSVLFGGILDDEIEKLKKKGVTNA